MPVPHVDVFGLTKHRFPSKIVICCSFLAVLKPTLSKPEAAVSLFGIYAFQTILFTSPFFPVTCPDVSQGPFVLRVWGGVTAFSKMTQILISRRFLAVLDVPNCYGTSPLGPLVLGLGLGVLHGAKHSLPGSLSAKMGVKKCDVSEFIKSTRNIHFKGR